MTTKHILLALLAALAPVLSPAAEPEAGVKKEVEHLIGYLGASGCQFSRNGEWFNAARAVEHLNRKYEYLRERNLVKSAEAFIKNAASESSMSGKPYLVRCAGQPDVQSAAWFGAELARLRGR
jgi:hypothetical protein